MAEHTGDGIFIFGMMYDGICVMSNRISVLNDGISVMSNRISVLGAGGCQPSSRLTAVVWR